jgi:hypothetical protein
VINVEPLETANQRSDEAAPLRSPVETFVDERLRNALAEFAVTSAARERADVSNPTADLC